MTSQEQALLLAVLVLAAVLLVLVWWMVRRINAIYRATKPNLPPATREQWGTAFFSPSPRPQS